MAPIPYNLEPSTAAALHRSALTLPSPFQFPPGEEILNIYDEHCVYCHGPEGGAHPLYTPEQWQNEIDLIIGVTASGYMPLSRPPLTEEEVYTLRAWQAADFPE